MKRLIVSLLIIPFRLSASHIAFGSIRIEPVFMVLGQRSAIIASLVIEKKISVQDLIIIN